MPDLATLGLPELFVVARLGLFFSHGTAINPRQNYANMMNKPRGPKVQRVILRCYQNGRGNDKGHLANLCFHFKSDPRRRSFASRLEPVIFRSTRRHVIIRFEDVTVSSNIYLCEAFHSFRLNQLLLCSSSFPFIRTTIHAHNDNNRQQCCQISDARFLVGWKCAPSVC